MQVEMWGRPMLVLSSCLQPQDRGHTTAGLCRAIKEQHSHSLAWRGLCARLILSGCKTHPASLHSFPASIWVLHRPQLPLWHIHPLWNGVLHSLSDGYILEHQLSTGCRDISAWVPGALPAPLLLSWVSAGPFLTISPSVPSSFQLCGVRPPFPRLFLRHHHLSAMQRGP